MTKTGLEADYPHLIAFLKLKLKYLNTNIIFQTFSFLYFAGGHRDQAAQLLVRLSKQIALESFMRAVGPDFR